MAVVDATDGVVYPNLSPGVTPFLATVTIATTSLNSTDDDVLLFKFPDPAYLVLSSLWVKPSDMDSDGTPALQVDYGIGDSDGVIDTVLIADSAAPQTGAADVVDAGLTTVSGLVDVGGKYLIQTVKTAASTAAAGTVSVGGLFATNLVPITSS
jgi:hypothetical protein